MPRWFFLICVTALTLSVIGGVLIVLRSPSDRPQANPAPTAAPPQAGAR